MRIKKIYRLAQMPPPLPGMPPPPPGGGMPPMGGPMGTPDMGGMPPIPPPGAPPSDMPKEKIGSPLSSAFEILYDADALQRLQSDGKTTEELAADIWSQYGGTETGDVDSSKMGARNPKDKNVTPEGEEQEEEDTEDMRWQRLPKGKTIGDITTLDSLEKALQGIASGLKKPAAPPAGAGGGMPPGMASSIPTLVKLASLYDKCGRFKEADILDKILNNIV